MDWEAPGGNARLPRHTRNRQAYDDDENATGESAGDGRSWAFGCAIADLAVGGV